MRLPLGHGSAAAAPARCARSTCDVSPSKVAASSDGHAITLPVARSFGYSTNGYGKRNGSSQKEEVGRGLLRRRKPRGRSSGEHLVAATRVGCRRRRRHHRIVRRRRRVRNLPWNPPTVVETRHPLPRKTRLNQRCKQNSVSAYKIAKETTAAKVRRSPILRVVTCRISSACVLQINVRY